MKKFFLIAAVVLLTACGTAYNTQLKQVELGMTQEQIVNLMGNKYTVANTTAKGQTLEYKDRYKNHWFFQFENDKLTKWYKETEQ